MKVRIEGNFIRLRLGKSEVGRLAEKGRVGGATRFPQGEFRYELELSATAENLEADLTGTTIVIRLPEAWGLEWPDAARVGFEHQLALQGGETLHLLIEKDFVCLDRDPAGQVDQYPNPKAGTL